MFSIYNKNKFENFTEMMTHAFSARTKENLIKIMYEYLPKIVGGDILIFIPAILQDKEIELTVPKIKEFTTSEKDIIIKIKEAYKSGNIEYAMVINDWYVKPVKIKNDIIFTFAAENRAMEKLNIPDEQKENILSVVASLLLRIDTMEEENNRNIQAEKEKLRTQILSSVSHDLKTPLAAIIGALNLLVSMNIKLSDDKRNDLMETTITEAQRLNSFITNILNMARIESGAVKPKMEWHSLDDLVKHIKKNFKLKYPERSLKVQDVPNKVSLYIDSIMFEQIIFSILDNAAKYSPPKTEIELSVTGDTQLDFLIRDHGNGIPDDMLEKIFDKYTRIQLEDRKVAGTGLGLAISKSLANLQNLKISALNHKEGGIVFKVSCPEWKIEK